MRLTGRHAGGWPGRSCASHLDIVGRIRCHAAQHKGDLLLQRDGAAHLRRAEGDRHAAGLAAGIDLLHGVGRTGRPQRKDAEQADIDFGADLQVAGDLADIGSGEGHRDGGLLADDKGFQARECLAWTEFIRNVEFAALQLVARGIAARIGDDAFEDVGGVPAGAVVRRQHRRRGGKQRHARIGDVDRHLR